MKNILFVLFLLFNFCCFSQVDPLGDWNRQVAANWSGKYFRVGPYKVKGSPFLFGESFRGNIVYKGRKEFTDRKILYDLLNQKAGLDDSSNLFESDDPVEEFTMMLPDKLGGQKLLFINSNAFGSSAPVGFFNVLEDGEKVTLLKAYKTKLIPDPVNTMAPDIRAFEQYHEYFVYLKDQKKLKKIKPREKDLVNELAHEDEIKTFIKENSISLSKEADLVKLVHYYNRNFKAAVNNN